MSAQLKTIDETLAHDLEDFNLIGRSQDATIRLVDSGISRQHATIRREGQLFWVTDLGSANGSYVNDVAISTARALRSGDRIQFGNSQFWFHQDDPQMNGGAYTPGTSTQGMQTQVIKTNALPMKTLEATLLVGDLKDFTNLSAQLTAEEVAALLREWYADCELILKPRGAIIDKFMGDGVFAYWPKSDEKSVARAAECALLLSDVDAVQSPRRQWVQDNLGITVQCHVGLHLGEVALGAMGRGVNTAVGEAVNVTFRIEALTRRLNTRVLASADLVNRWPEVTQCFENAGIHEVKGQPDPVEVYKLKM
jgi:adenylate cyclase